MSAWLARLRPRSLTVQLMAWLIAGLVLCHLVGIFLLTREHDELHPRAQTNAIDLVVRVFDATALLPPHLARAALAYASDREGHFTLLEAPREHPATTRDGDDDAEMRALLRQRLGPRGEAARVCLGAPCPMGLTPPPASARPAKAVVMQLPRTDGLWMQATLWPPVRELGWWSMVFWLQCSLVMVLVASAFALRRIVRPVRTLVEVAGRVSQGERIPPLKLEGPREMREVLQAFNQMQERIGNFVSDRMQMLAAIGHDFRTPITSLRLRAELLDDAGSRHAMVRTLNELQHMVDETLRFASADAQASAEATETVNLVALLDQLLTERLRLGLPVRWAGPLPPAQACRCRPLSVRRLFANLIDNAVRHGGNATLSLWADAQQGHVVVCVDDEGPGLDPAHLEALFAPFARLSPERASASGTGLGLAIARTCARAHGGDVRLENRLPKGLRARVQLPLPHATADAIEDRP